MIHFHGGLGDGSGKGAFFPGPLFRATAPKNETTGDGPHGLRVVACGHEILGVERKHGLDRASAAIGKTIFQCRHRQTRIVRIPRLERTPANDFGDNRQSIIGQGNGAEREARFERSLGETRQAVSCAGGPIARSGRAKQFSRWHRSLQHFGDSAFSFD